MQVLWLKDLEVGRKTFNVYGKSPIEKWNGQVSNIA